MLELMKPKMSSRASRPKSSTSPYHSSSGVAVEAKLKDLISTSWEPATAPLISEAGYHKMRIKPIAKNYLAVQSATLHRRRDTFERFAKLCDEYVSIAQSRTRTLELAIQV